MSLFAVSDLHLSFYNPKPMDIFGENWKNHYSKLKENWNSCVTENDTVLIPGDISWSKNLTEVAPDIEFINKMSGKKIFVPGNHDYWWNSTNKLNEAYNKDNMYFLKNNFIDYDGIAVCGSRGWLCPNDTYYTDHDYKIYIREVNRLKMSLESAVNKGYKDIILIMHFPPTNDKKEDSLFLETIFDYPVRKVIYGHLHGESSFDSSYKGNINCVDFILVSADYLDFKPIKIL